ncbi:hypothetical protein [Halobaculum sp. MBLA0143]|uniref:hypothetical protein n=1 Tax=Halobaculum sp. MBLA0143 TaxID=3079933 RepID=UPI003525CF53
MPTKAAGSHTLSALVALFASATLSKYVWQVLPSLGEVSQSSLTLVDRLPVVSVPTDAEAAGALLVIVVVTVVWEVAHYARGG